MPDFYQAEVSLSFNILFFHHLCLHLQTEQNYLAIMTALELNAELLRNMSIIAEDENLLKRAVRYMRKLVAEKQADHTEMTREEFFGKLDKAEKDIAEGKGITFNNLDDMNAWLNSL